MKTKYKLITTSVITTLTAASISALNKMIFISSTHKEVLSKNRGLTYEWRFGNIYYTKRGQGKPLLLIHDLILGSCDYEWKEIIDKLSNEYTIYTIDLLGFGRSDKPNITYTNYLYVQLLNDFIKNIIGKRTDIICSGSSCSIGVMACCNDSSLFDRILLVNPDSILKTNQLPNKQTKILKFLIECPIIGTFTYNIMASKHFMEEDFIIHYMASPTSLSNNLIHAYHEAAHLNGAACKYIFSSLISNYTNFSISHKLKDINNSIFILGGREENYIEQTIKDYQLRNPIIESALVPHSKHFPQLEQPQEFLKQCQIFLA